MFTKRLKPKTTEIFDTYWRFSAKRQKILFARINSQPIQSSVEDNYLYGKLEFIVKWMVVISSIERSQEMI